MTPAEFDRMCYDLELHNLPQELQDAWREMAIGTLKSLSEKWKVKGDGYTKPSVYEMLKHAAELAYGAQVKCSSDSLGSGEDWNTRHLDDNGNWYGSKCSEFFVYAIAADKRNRK